MKNKNDTVLLIGYLPPPVTGMTSAFQLLVDGLVNRNISTKVINLTSIQRGRIVGTFTWKRFIEISHLTFVSILNIIKMKNTYLIPGISKVGFLFNAPIIIFARLLNRNIVLHIHSGGFERFYNDQSGLFKRAIKYVYGKVNQIIVLDDDFKQHFEFLKGSDVKITTIPNCLPNNISFPEHLVEKKIIDQKIELLFLSNMLEGKGYLDVLEACRIMNEETDMPFHCNFAGVFYPEKKKGIPYSAEQLKNNFLKKIKQYKLTSKVTYWGYVTGDEKTHLLTKSHIFILPTYLLEGQPLALIEAMAFGLPIIGTNFRGSKSQIIEGYNGFFVQPQNAQSIVFNIKRIIKDPENYSKMSRCSRKLFDKKFSRKAHLMRIIPIVTNNDLLKNVLIE